MTGAQTADAVIVGGGLHGLSSAIHLAKAGVEVTLLEKDRIGRHASSANAGGVRRLGRALPEIPIAVAAIELWHDIESLVDETCGFCESVQIKVAEDAEGLNALQIRSQTVCDYGFAHEEMIDADTLHSLLPEVAKHCVGGLIVKGDGHADPFATVRAFHRKALSLGVRIIEGAPVTQITYLNGKWSVKAGGLAFNTPHLINAAGAWGDQISGMMGDHVPIQAQALMLMITERIKPFLSAVVGAEGRTLSFKQLDNGTVLIGGGYQGRAELEHGTTTLDMRQLAANATAAQAIFPLMNQTRITRAWAGIEGVTPDRMPVIGHAGQSGGFHLFGFSAHGFALAPICGRVITELILSQQTALPIQAFAVDRFQRVAEVT